KKKTSSRNCGERIGRTSSKLWRVSVGSNQSTASQRRGLTRSTTLENAGFAKITFCRMRLRSYSEFLHPLLNCTAAISQSRRTKSFQLWKKCYPLSRKKRSGTEWPCGAGRGLSWDRQALNM